LTTNGNAGSPSWLRLSFKMGPRTYLPMVLSASCPEI
jgi:hypothetical protein